MRSQFAGKKLAIRDHNNHTHYFYFKVVSKKDGRLHVIDLYKKSVRTLFAPQIWDHMSYPQISAVFHLAELCAWSGIFRCLRLHAEVYNVTKTKKSLVENRHKFWSLYGGRQVTLFLCHT